MYRTPYSGGSGSSYDRLYVQAALASSQNIPSITDDLLEARYMDAQIISIKSDQQFVTVSLPHLLPSISNISANSNDIYYQLESFLYTNKFYNVERTWGLEVRSSITFTTIASPYTSFTISDSDSLAAQPLIIPLTTDLINNKQTTSATEIANAMQLAINEIALGIRAGAAQLTPSNFSFFHLFSNVNLSFDVDTGKLSLTLQPGERYLRPILLSTDAGITPANFDLVFISDIKVWLYTPRYLPHADQLRIARLMGFADHYLTYGTWTRTDPIDDNLTGIPFYVWYCNFDTPMCTELFLKATSTTYQDFMKTIPKMKTIYAARPMQTSPLNAIYVHTSLLSNVWQYDGRKTDILDSIPVSGNLQDEQPTIYYPITTAGRIFNARDSLASLQNFSIYFTDENEDPLQFIEPYELRIAIFFKRTKNT